MPVKTRCRGCWQPVGGANSPVISKPLTCLTHPDAPIENIGENPRLSNPDLGLTKQNPGALAGATGTVVDSFWNWFDHNLKRASAARRLVAALLNCVPEDRALFLEILLEAIRPGFMRILHIDAMRECREWAADLPDAYRKAMALACYERLADADKRSFVAHITGARHG